MLNQYIQLLEEAAIAAGKEVGEPKHASMLLRDVKEAIQQKDRAGNVAMLPVRKLFDQRSSVGIA